MEEAKKSYCDAVAKLKTTEAEYQNLVKRLDSMESETNALNSKIKIAEDEEKHVYDSYFLGKVTDKDLSDAQKKVKAAKDAVSAHSKMLESLNRCIAGKDREIAALHKQVDNLRHKVWQGLFEQKAAEIPEPVKVLVKELVCVGLNCALGRDFILPKIFAMPTNSEIQNIYKKISEEIGIA